MNNNKFVTVITCMDGRVQIPVNEYLRNKYQATYVDTITEAGPDKILASNEKSFLLDNIKERVSISVNHHNSKVLSIVGHFGCAGNPVDYKTHIDHIIKSIETIKFWDLKVEILGLWVDESWKVHEVI